MHIAHGIFSWDREERVTNRYGSFFLGDRPYNNDAFVQSTLDLEAFRSLIGRRVRLTLLVKETRTSGHVGDSSLGIKPSTPSVGEVIDLGVGILGKGKNWDGKPTIVLMPVDDREELWMDPRLLYRLHDQTVGLDAEPTEEPISPVPNLPSAKEGIFSLGDGSFQTKKTNIKDGEKLDVKPHIERLGSGMFSLSYPPPPEGQRIEKTR